MNPFKVNKIIRESDLNDTPISIDTLSQLCGGKIRHRYVRMSQDVFACPNSKHFPRHWVEGLKLHSWITLWFYHPPKIEDMNKQENEISK